MLHSEPSNPQEESCSRSAGQSATWRSVRLWFAAPAKLEFHHFPGDHMPTSNHPRVTPPVSASHGKHAFTVWAIIIGVCLAALAGTYLLFVGAPPPRRLVIATGGKTGAYYQFAQKYAAELQKEGLTLDIRETKGSVENLQLLEDQSEGVSIAIVQSGVATPEDSKKLVSLGSLYREPLWVFYRRETPLFVEEPMPKKVAIATGSKNGAYFHFAVRYAEELRKEGVDLAVRETRGSVENLQLLKDKASDVDAAIVQSGVCGPDDHQQLWALGSLYREPLWVFYRGDKKFDRLSELAGKRIGVGPPGSGTYMVAMQLLAANGLVKPGDAKADTAAVVVEGPVDVAAEKLRKGELDAAFFVAAIDAEYVKVLMKDGSVRLLSFQQHKAYHHKLRFLSEVTLPAGLINLGRNFPAEDTYLVAPTAMLVVRKQAHAALARLLLTTAARIHAKGDQLSNPDEFPSAAYTDLPVSEEAKQFYKTGSFTLPRLPPIDRLSYLEGKRINVGPEGSGTYAVAVQLLQANDMVSSDGMTAKVSLVKDDVTRAAESLRKGKLDAAFFVAAPEAKYIQDLINDPYIRLLSFSQRQAYHRKFRYLSEITIPPGLFNLGRNIPRQDIDLVAPTAMLVVRKDLHPDLVPVLLSTATRIHGKGDELTNPGEFPSASYTDLPVSEDAKHFYKYGPPVLQRMLPFWLASLTDRLKIMLIPLIVLLMPLFRAAPPLVRWRTRRKIYLWYSALRDIDKKIALGLSGPQLDAEIARLNDIDHQVAFVQVPLSYMEEFYDLRVHVTMVQENLEKLRANQAERKTI
jgi:TRAP transporter TAXI family solute receptor